MCRLSKRACFWYNGGGYGLGWLKNDPWSIFEEEMISDKGMIVIWRAAKFQGSFECGNPAFSSFNFISTAYAILRFSGHKLLDWNTLVPSWTIPIVGGKFKCVLWNDICCSWWRQAWIGSWPGTVNVKGNLYKNPFSTTSYDVKASTSTSCCISRKLCCR